MSTLDSNLADGRTYTVSIELDVTVTDAMAFRTAIAQYAQDDRGNLALVNHASGLGELTDFVVRNVTRPELWNVPGAAVKIGAASATNYIPPTEL